MPSSVPIYGTKVQGAYSGNTVYNYEYSVPFKFYHLSELVINADYWAVYGLTATFTADSALTSGWPDVTYYYGYTTISLSNE